jgi:hypothetical protein
VLALLAPAPAAGLDLKKLDLKRKYEEQLIRWALKQSGLERDPRPAGKTIERIEIVREDIIAQSDPWPNFFNYLHVKTRDHVVRQELLVHPGQPWDQQKVDESARNLRALFILAVVRAVPCRSSKPGQVVLLVVTKDLWSIRLNTIFSQVGGVLQQIEFFPTEMNFLGRNKRVSLHVRMRQLALSGFTFDQLSLGQLYIDYRFFGTRLKLTEFIDVHLAGDVPCGGKRDGQTGVWCADRSAGDVEGAYALLRLQRPLFSLATEWGFDSWFTFDIKQRRLYRGTELRVDTYPTSSGRTTVPRLYNWRVFSGHAAVTRSLGLEIKHDLTAGFAAYSFDFAHPENLETVYPAEVLAWHRLTYLPRSETAAYLFGKYRTHSPRFVRLRNIQGFALSEDFALGHDLSVEARFAANLVEAGHSFVTLVFNSRYRWYFADDLLTVWFNARGRLQPGLDELGYRDQGFRGSWANALIELGAKNVSPKLWIGRIHTRIQAKFRENDLDRDRFLVGGNSGIRGYLADQFEGDNLFQFNLEYRSRPLNIFTLHLGFVIFYDAGTAYGGPDPYQPGSELPFRYHHSVGGGVRGHFPQFDKESLRLDFGIPLSSERPSVGNWISFSFMQVF